MGCSGIPSDPEAGWLGVARKAMPARISTIGAMRVSLVDMQRSGDGSFVSPSWAVKPQRSVHGHFGCQHDAWAAICVQEISTGVWLHHVYADQISSSRKIP